MAPEQRKPDADRTSVAGLQVAPTREDSPRRTIPAIGMVFQVVGGTFLLGACLVWALSAWTVQAADEPARHWLDYLSGERLSAAGLTIGILTTLTGGIGLSAVGMGIQGERPTSGRAAMLVTTILTVIYGGLVFLHLLAPEGSRLLAIISGFFGLICVLLLCLAAHSAQLLRRLPPRPEQNVVSSEEY